MTFSWESNIELANHLLAIDEKDMWGDPEVYYRAIVARSYYACHKSVHEWIESHPSYSPPPRTTSIHKFVIDNVATYMKAPHARNIERYLDVLKADRVDADYELLPLSPWSKSRAQSRVEDAEFLLEELKKAHKV